ncbi:hypothetical protein TIFTF001_020335 [Ficus carica]|uniref:Uncharacterized protein n=1 Tax=Ficus carica TaxID=3494 RepID=A0AA88ADH4_FICCA|nr:hypothetical protein TIFTF001_020335 [Ficus carica]
MRRFRVKHYRRLGRSRHDDPRVVDTKARAHLSSKFQPWIWLFYKFLAASCGIRALATFRWQLPAIEESSLVAGLQTISPTSLDLPHKRRFLVITTTRAWAAVRAAVWGAE